MKLKQALNVVSDVRIHLVIEATEGHFEYKTLDYVGDIEPLRNALEFVTKWRERKVSFIHYNKAREALEIDCYMK